MKLKYYLSGLGVGIIVTSLILMIISSITPIDDEAAIKRAKELGYVESTSQHYFNELKNSSGIGTSDNVEAGLLDSSDKKEEDGKVSDNDTLAHDDISDNKEVPGGTSVPIFTPIPSTTSISSENSNFNNTTSENNILVTPVLVPDITVALTPAVTLTVTPKVTPISTPKLTPKVTPISTPKPTPKVTPIADISPSIAPSITPAITIEQKDSLEDITEKNENETDVKEPVEGIDYQVLIVTKGTGAASVCEELYRLGLIDDSKKFLQYLKENGYTRYIQVCHMRVPFGMTYEELAKKITNYKK
ncbi:MAG: hypothetical protein MJ113_07015 [Lachnospiraceae bacterium]|nr:hypothetical protein [Lachnospiraceae bacterium]